MELNNATSFRQMLEQMSTEALREMLDQELHAEPVNDDAIRLLMGILRERKNNVTVEMTPNLERAWEKYQRDTDEIWKESRRSGRVRIWIARAAAAAAVLVLLLVPIVPQEAGAESLWDALVRWTTGIVEFFGPSDNKGRIEEYEFRTDNPGLQQVYDAVLEMGVTEPVVPMWLPEGYELTEYFIRDLPSKTRVHSRFVNEDQELVFYIDVYQADVSRKYQMNELVDGRYEYGGVEHQILQNYDLTAVVWTRDQIECFLSVRCQEDILRNILKSIYTSEEH